MKILVADHNEILGELIKYELELANHHVFLVTDGMEALKMLDQHTPDMVITDILLPFFSGLELINHIHHHKDNIPKIIVLTQIHNENTVSRAFELGIDDYITKPFDLDYLSLKIEKLWV
jgi:DNA-binding response OmpR family regulator